jgi:hypothetical protein
VRVDQRLAQRDVRYGAIGAAVGAALVIGGAIAFDCGPNDFPLFCALGSERNLGAAVAFLGGFALAAGGVGYLVSGYAAQSDVDAKLKRSAWRWHVGPTGIALRF